MISILYNLETYLKNDLDLSFIEAVKIGKYNIKGSLPTFDTYAVMLSPVRRETVRLANHVYQHVYYFEAVCIVRDFDKELSLTGDAPGATGIIAAVDKVSQSLKDFCTDNKELYEIMGDEVTLDVVYNTHPFPEREGYFHETAIPFKIRTTPFTQY